MTREITAKLIGFISDTESQASSQHRTAQGPQDMSLTGTHLSLLKRTMTERLHFTQNFYKPFSIFSFSKDLSSAVMEKLETIELKLAIQTTKPCFYL